MPRQPSIRSGGTGASRRVSRASSKDAYSPGSKDGSRSITRQTQSCDACRARKVRCDRQPPPEGQDDGERCSRCEGIDVPCVFTRIPKRRGPKNRYALLHSDLAEPGTSAAAAPSPRHSPPSHSAPTSVPARPSAPADLSWLVPDQGSQQSSPLTALSVSKTPRVTLEVSPIAEATPSGISSLRHSYPVYPHNHSNVLDNMLPRGLFYKIIDLHFQYIYPLTPLVHRPTFQHDIDSRREDRDGEDEWTAMVLALVAVTISQLPHPLVPIPRDETSALVQRCYQHARGWQVREFEEFSITRATMLIFLSQTAAILDKRYTAPTYMGMLLAALSTRGFQYEAAYLAMPPLERELWRRIWWIAYYGDRTTVVLNNRMSLMHEDDCASVDLPREIDDAFLTEEAYLSQPPEHVPILSGFVYSCRLYRLLGEVLEKRRRDTRDPPRDTNLALRQLELDHLQDQVTKLMDGCPRALVPEIHNPEQTLANLINLDDAVGFLFPSAPLADEHPFRVQQVNIYVTQQMVRMVILQYRMQLGRLQAEQVERGGPIQNMASFEDEKDNIVGTLLGILESIPLDIVAVNTRWLVHKIRFVASTLLDAPDATSPVDQISRSQRYLWDLLRILGDLESMYSCA